MKLGICVIAYNRINSLRRVLNSILEANYENDEVELIISIDKSNVLEVVEYAKKFKWKVGKKTVIEHPVNLGLRAHVLKCGDLLEYFDGLIVLEDDLTVSMSFYLYAKQCVECYYNDEKIAGISLYSFPVNYHNGLPFEPILTDSDVYLMQCAQSWGQVWMKNQWKSFKQWYDDNCEEFSDLPHLPQSICNWPKSSWLKYHTKYCIERDRYFVYPYASLSTNNGDSGTHCFKKNTLFQTSMLYGNKINFNLVPKVKYDGFFESELIYNLLNFNKTQLCIDYYGEKRNRENKPYWLTTTCQPYKIIRSFALEQKPYEWNIINNIRGKDLFLYDTHTVSNKTKKTIKNGINQFKYMYNIGSISESLKKIFKFVT